MQIDRLDHFVLTVADLDATIAFYQKVLGMTPVTFGEADHLGLFPRSRPESRRSVDLRPVTPAQTVALHRRLPG